MAIHICQKCGDSFVRTTRGRPPKFCPTCQGNPTPAPAPKPAETPAPAPKGNKYPLTLSARYAGTCFVCGAKIYPNDLITMEGKGKARHATCDGVPAPAPEAPAPLVNTPDSSEALAALLKMIESLSQSSINEDRVSELIQTEIAKALDSIEQNRPVETHVHLTDGEVRKIEGRQHHKLPMVIKMINSGINVLLVGPAGSGKSTILEQAAEALGLPYHTLSVDGSATRTALFGYQDANGTYHPTPIRKGYDDDYEPGLVNIDEIDNGHPSVIGGMNQLLSNGTCTFPDGTVKRSAKNAICATANTYGTGPNAQYVGRNALDAATLDRFAIVSIDYDLALERELALAESNEHGARWHEKVLKFRTNAQSSNLKVVISPRATINGARMLREGIPESEVIEMVIRKGLTDDQWAKVSEGV